MKQDIILDQIDLLTNEWKNLINDKYHKRYDCYFCIKIIWEYGNKRKYAIEHFGNLLGQINKTFDTYDKAIIYLYKFLKRNIKKINE